MHQAKFDDSKISNIFHTFFTGPDLFDSRIADCILNVAVFIYTQDGNNPFIFWVHTSNDKDCCGWNTILGDMARYGVQIGVFDWDEEVHGTIIGNDTFYAIPGKTARCIF